MKPAPFTHDRPDTAAAVASALAGDGAKIIAGGQSLGPMMNLRLARPAHLVGLTALPGMVEITETGRALRAAGLKVIDTILTSYTEVVANPIAYANPEKRKAMEQVMTLLNGVLDARGRVLLKLNVSEANKDAVLAKVPSMKSPTVSPLSDGGYAVESVVEKRTINLVIPDLREAGATDLVEMPISKIVP